MPVPPTNYQIDILRGTASAIVVDCQTADDSNTDLVCSEDGDGLIESILDMRV
jgi:hypothetical protein